VALRIVFMGTGGFAVPAFSAILESCHNTVGLFTQPDRTGSGHHRHVNPLKRIADDDIPVFQPEKANLPEPIEQLRSLEPDLCVVAAYGQILSAELLGVPRLGAVNLHASLLPKYRGAAPIQAAILNGETETGVTIFQIEPKLDAGPILAMERIPIGPKETAGELQVRLAALGASMILPVLDHLEAGTAVPLVQDSAQASRAPRLKKESGRIDWAKTPAQIDCQVRAFHPWPMAYTTLPSSNVGQAASLPFSKGQSESGQASSLPHERQRLIILEVTTPSPLPPQFSEPTDAPPGTILFADRKRLIVQTGGGPLEILRLQAEGKRAMATSEFLAGRQLAVGETMG
jgi:methionyl-tRNA formyltransferase